MVDVLVHIKGHLEYELYKNPRSRPRYLGTNINPTIHLQSMMLDFFKTFYAKCSLKMACVLATT